MLSYSVSSRVENSRYFEHTSLAVTIEGSFIARTSPGRSFLIGPVHVSIADSNLLPISRKWALRCFSDLLFSLLVLLFNRLSYSLRKGCFTAMWNFIRGLTYSHDCSLMPLWFLQCFRNTILLAFTGGKSKGSVLWILKLNVKSSPLETSFMTLVWWSLYLIAVKNEVLYPFM